ncbi:MAG: hypothetical protein ACLVL7_05280 [Anaerotruncus massiliensis (ex Togo et al. 2019)]
MLAFDPDADATANQLAMQKAFERVGTGQVTFAARDSDFDGPRLRRASCSRWKTAGSLHREGPHPRGRAAGQALTHRDSSFVTLLYGEEIEDGLAESVREAVADKLPDDVEVALIKGGQPVYYFIISVE